MEGRNQPKVLLRVGVGVGVGARAELPAGAQRLGGWGAAGAILTEEDTGLASASEKEGEDAALEAFPRRRGPRE